MSLLTDTELEPPPGVADAIDDMWTVLALPGATLTGTQRIEIAGVARAGGGDGSPRHVTAERIARSAHTIDRAFVDRVLADGLTIHKYVEILGVVARTVAVDTAVRGLGASPIPLPEPVDGDPTGATDGAAKQRSSLVPTVGAANPVTVLNSLPAESQAQERLSNALYMSYAQMAEMDIERGLHRTQIELVAARTSSVNECVY